MSITATSYFNPENLCTVEDVLVSLDLLGLDLSLAELERLDRLHRMYLVISRNIRLELQQGNFDYPDFMERFDRRLTYRYLHALRGYLLDGDVVPAWRAAFDTAISHRARSLACITQGLNAHINKDIPEALRDCRADQRHFNDYRRVLAIIGASLDEIISRSGSKKRLPGPRAGYRLGLQYLLALWRYTAWHNFSKLMDYHTGIVVIEHKAGRTGSGITRLPI